MTSIEHDLRLAQNATNYARSMFEGRFASFNVLGQLGSSDFDQKLFDQAKKAGERCQVWLDAVYESNPILSVSWTKAETLESCHLMEILKFCKDDLNYTYQRVERITRGRDKTDQKSQAAFLVAAICRAGYSKLLYVLNLVEFGKRFEIVEVRDTFEAMVNGAFELRELSHQSFARLLSEPLTETLFEALSLTALGQIPLFRAQIHDLNQILHIYDRPFTYEQAEFSAEEAALWQRLEFPPEIAGYWRACLFTPEESAMWAMRGMNVAQSAFEFKVFGFTPDVAEYWFREGFSPMMALEFSQQGLTPHQTLARLGKAPLNPVDYRPPLIQDTQEPAQQLLSAPTSRLGIGKILNRESGERS